MTNDSAAELSIDDLLQNEDDTQSKSDIIRRRFEKKIAESSSGQLTPAASGANASASERPRSAVIASQHLAAQNNKPTVRPNNSEQSTEGVHPNAVKDPLNFCVVCGKRVYQLEKIAAHKGIYHKSCFRCEVCETTLRPGSFSVLEGHLFCKPHLIQQFKTRGKYETSAAFKAREANANGVHASAVQNENAAAE